MPAKKHTSRRAKRTAGKSVAFDPSASTLIPKAGEWSPGMGMQDDAPFKAPTDPLGKDAAKREPSGAGTIYRDVPALANVSGWDWCRIQAALDAHCIGIFQQSAIMFDAMTGDDRIQESINSRISGMLGCPTVFEAGEGDEDGQVLAAWKKAYDGLGGYSQSPESAIAENERWRHGMGFGVSQILWNTDGDIWWPSLRAWHPQYIYFDWNSRQLIAITQDGLVPIIPGNGRWFVHSKGIYRSWMQGGLRSTALPWLLRNFAWRDWARYSERHGLPIIKAFMPSSASATDKAGFQASLVDMGREAVVGLPTEYDGQKFDVQLLEASDQSWMSFKGLIEQANSSITITYQWQNLTTEVKEGSQAAARVHGDVKQTAIEDDNECLKKDIREQIARPFAAWNFGKPDAAPHTYYDVTPQEDRNAKLSAFSSFAQSVSTLRAANVPVDVEKLAAMYKVDLATAKVVGGEAPPLYQYHLTSPVVTINEARARLGYGEVPNGDRFVSEASAEEKATITPVAKENPANEAP